MTERWNLWCRQIGLWLAKHGGWDETSIRDAAVAPYQEALSQARASLNETLTILASVQEDYTALKARMATSATVDPAVFARATELTGDADTTLTGGEAKRHAVYARLIKDFPTTTRRELGLAIELALAAKEG
jgi:hypothetical protein